jgi:hypothetical protein
MATEDRIITLLTSRFEGIDSKITSVETKLDIFIERISTKTGESTVYNKLLWLLVAALAVEKGISWVR